MDRDASKTPGRRWALELLAQSRRYERGADDPTLIDEVAA